MHIISRRKAIYFVITLGVCLIAAAVALSVSWIILNWRAGLMLFFGGILFLVIIAGMVLNTIFLVREIRRNEQHDSFINAVTHELKTPIASIRQLNSCHDLELSQQVGQVFRELVMNAVEWGGKPDSARRTRIACIRTKRMLLYRIADTGPG